MDIIVTKINPKKTSLHGGTYTRVFFKDINTNKTCRLDVYDGHSQSIRWLEFIKPQAIFSNVSLFKDNIIDGTSNFRFIGIKNE